MSHQAHSMPLCPGLRFQKCACLGERFCLNRREHQSSRFCSCLPSLIILLDAPRDAQHSVLASQKYEYQRESIKLSMSTTSLSPFLDGSRSIKYIPGGLKPSASSTILVLRSWTPAVITVELGNRTPRLNHF